MYIFRGKLTQKLGLQVIGQNGFQKLEFIISEDKESKYANDIKFELLGEKVNLLDNFKIDDMVEVTFRLRGKFWLDKNFTTIEAIQIKALEKSESNNDKQFPF